MCTSLPKLYGTLDCSCGRAGSKQPPRPRAKKGIKRRTPRVRHLQHLDRLTEGEALTRERAVKCFLAGYCFWHCSAVLRRDKTRHKTCWPTWSVDQHRHWHGTQEHSSEEHDLTRDYQIWKVSTLSTDNFCSWSQPVSVNWDGRWTTSSQR